MEPGPSSAQATLAHYWDDVSNDTLTGAQDIPAAITESKARVAITTVFAPLAILVFVYWIGHYAIGWRRSQREKTFQRELRRRHGIPDDDHRPFNVAYQAASIAARNSVRQSLSSQAEHPQSSQALQNNTSSTTIMEGFRPQPRSRPPIPAFPGQPPVRVPSGSFNFGQPQPPPVSGSDSSRAFSQLPHAAASASWGPRYSVDNFRATSVPTVPTVSSRSAFAIAAASGSRRTSAVYAPGVNAGTGDRRTWSSAARPVTASRSTGNISQGRVRKRLYLTADEEADEQQSDIPNDKRSRTAGWGSEAMIDGDNEPLWAQSHPIESKPASDQRAPQSGKSKGKRLADDGEGDLRVDGKRRQTKSTKAHRPKPEVVQETRGTKRDRKDVDTASVLNDVMPVHKRGRAGDHNPDLTMVEEEDDAEEEEEDPTVSRDPLCGGRRIGQKWTANGQEYMVGANGDRLRFTTVKESRKRYYMPTDSKHADNLHKVEVFVEKWLTEEQYAKAKGDGLLAWQENENLPTPAKPGSPEKALEGKENQGQDERPRSISTTAITVSRIPQAQRAANTIWNTPGQSPLQTSSPHTNPFNTPPSATTPQSPGPRRMRYSMGTLPATSMNSSRLIPTWEKQEREANALKILRERRAAEAAKSAPAPAPAPTPAPVPNPAPVPAIILTAPSTESPTPQATEQPAAKPSLFSLAAPAPKPVDPTPAPAPISAPAAANPFSFAAPKKDEAPKPLFSATPAPALAATTATTTAPSLFAPQPTTSVSSTPGFGVNPSPAPAPAATASPFGALSSTAAPTAPATVSPFGAPTSTAATKPSPFAFAAQSNTPKPADSVPAATSTPFGTTPFGGAAPAAPAPSPFGATPAAPSPAATKPMGGFSFTPTPAAASSAAPATTTAPGSSLFSAPAPKPAATGFSFNPNGASSAKPAGNAFSFGGEGKPAAAPTSNGFGNVGAGISSGFGNTASGQSTNVFGNNTASGSSGFGNGFVSNSNSGASASPFAFGAPKATGATTSGFGSQPAAQPAATPAFGSQTAAPTSSTFKFGEASAASSTPTTATGSGFQFGAPKPTLSIPQTTSFGAPASATPTTASGTGFTFGANTNAAAAASPATPSKPLFSLGAAASPVLGTRQISTSKRVQRAMSKPPQ